ncbi:MAG: hypothetical protein HY980_02735 [Candidatus Magasanikbacteria bacterium]|nr:hypothetical protein [Candidatus Magasanikbacteria bacterium]
MTKKDFIKKHPYLFWYIQNPQGISDNVFVEVVLNYGDFDDVKKMLRIVGFNKARDIFFEHSTRPRHNYDPKIKHYFELFFNTYASGDTI